MTKQPEALRLADVLIGSPQFTGTPIWQAAAMLRRQHEAIKQLRECLIDCLDDSRQAVCEYEVTYGEHFRPQRLAAMRKTVTDAEQALKDTEGL